MFTRILGAVLCLVVAAAAHGQGVTIQGTVVDAKGDPVQGASVATTWLEGRPSGGVTTDQEGRFSLETRGSGRARAVLIMDEDRTHGVISRYDPGFYDEEKTLKLKKLVKVQGKFSCSDLGDPPPWTNVYANITPDRIRIGRCSSREAEFSFLLPPGEYELYMYGTDAKKRFLHQSIEGDEGVIDLETIDLDATEIAKMYGKEPPPWTVTDARGVGKDVLLSDYKGKYVLLEFWGFW